MCEPNTQKFTEGVHSVGNFKQFKIWVCSELPHTKRQGSVCGGGPGSFLYPGHVSSVLDIFCSGISEQA